MKFKADCSFLLEDTLAPNCMAAQCLGLLADLGLNILWRLYLLVTY